MADCDFERFKVDTPDVVINGLRVARSSGLPIILVHGVMSNSYAWECMAQRLYEAGYDVWIPNLRGHGNGDLRSYVKARSKGSYSFIQMVADLPPILQHVYSVTRKKIVLVGHSHGAGIIKTMLAGYTLDLKTDGKVLNEPNWAREISRKYVRGYINIGGPPSFKTPSREIALLARFGAILCKRFGVGIPSPAMQVNFLNGKLSYEVAKNLLSPSIVNIENFDHSQREFQRLGPKVVSGFPADLALSYLDLLRTGKVFEGSTNYDLIKALHVPCLYIAGEFDPLAPPDAMKKEVQALESASGRKVEFFVAEKTGHADLVLGSRASRVIGDEIVKFVAKLDVRTAYKHA